MIATFVLALGLAQAPSGSALFESHCATCHGGNDPRMPTVAVLEQHTAAEIVSALTSGVMRQRGTELPGAEKRAVADYLGAAASATTLASASAGACAASPPFDPSEGPHWNGWGAEPTNTRFQPTDQAGLTAAQVPKLKLK
jgi:polyvinyl alcohol dehydrogenase (cytochrome)